MASLVTLGEHRPVVAESAFLAAGAVLIGCVTVSAGATSSRLSQILPLPRAPDQLRAHHGGHRIIMVALAC